MIETVSVFYKKHSMLSISMACGFLVLFLGAVLYKQYVVAIAWHCINGNSVEVGSYHVKVPLLWTKVNSDEYGESRLVRATSIFSSSSDPEVVVRPAGSSVDKTTNNDEESRSIQQVVTRRQQSVTGESSKLVIIHSGLFDFSCFKDAIKSSSTNILVCRAKAVLYSFNYDGPSIYEKEAESIFSSVY